MIYDTEDPTLIAQINAEMKLIRDMVVVSELSFVASGAANAGFQVTLKCYAARQQQGSCRRKNVGPVRITRDRITLMDCLKELRRKLEEEHGSCISAVNEHAEIMQDNAPAVYRLVSFGQQRRRCTFDLAITGSASWETQVTARAAKRSSSWDLEGGKITRGRDFTMEIKLSSSRGG